MMYNNLIYFLVVIFVFTTNTPAQEPVLGPLFTLGVCLLVFYLFTRVCVRLFSRVGYGSAGGYFSAEKKCSLLAVLLFTLLVYGLDLKTYLRMLNLDATLPILENLAGLSLFLLLLCSMWQRARPAYERVFNREYTSVGFIFSNIKANLPIVLPWLFLSLAFDVVALLPFPRLHAVLASPWGDLALFVFFVVFLVLFFPPLVRWLWGCRPMPEGTLRRRIEAFCHAQGFHSDILIWPLFEGQVLTAGIMGILPRFRYLLVTPALLAAMSRDELDAVLAHEIGHVKKLHLVLYVLLFLGFSIIAGALAEPLPYLLLSSDFFYAVLDRTTILPETLLGILGAVPLLVLLLVYFRFVFGYFIRNFERQADLYVFAAQGTAVPLVGAFEKISRLSGNIREQKNWHHFGIAERVDILEKSEVNRGLIRRHDRKVYWSLAAYFICIGAVVLGVRQLDTSELAQGSEIRYAEAVLKNKARQDPHNSLWYLLLGDMLQAKEMEKKAIEAYGQALELSPTNPEVNNNLAWLLLTAKDSGLRDPQRALTLARTAALLKEEGYILDTLATAFWANGFVEEALLMATRAMELDPGNRTYYRSQLEKFSQQRWEDGP